MSITSFHSTSQTVQRLFADARSLPRSCPQGATGTARARWADGAREVPSAPTSQWPPVAWLLVKTEGLTIGSGTWKVVEDMSREDTFFGGEVVG